MPLIDRRFILACALSLGVKAVPLHAESSGILVADAWLRATPAKATVAAGFLHMANAGPAPDRLVTVAAPAIAEKTEIHQSIMKGTVAEMRQITGGVALPAGGQVSFKPGGLHLMFMGLKRPLSQGEHLKVTLTFEKAGRLDVDFVVRGIGAPAPMPAH